MGSLAQPPAPARPPRAPQADINEKMRAILVDWLVEVHLKFKLMPETLFLTVNLIDRFLEAKPVTRRNLQLVGARGATCSGRVGVGAPWGRLK